jgi:ABC-2 type transport system permease protein
MLGAGANTLPAALLFLGLAALTFAMAPRATASIIYSLVGVTFVWWVVGEVLEVPKWLLALSPFHDVGVVPGGSFKATAAAVMLAIAAITAIVAIARFEQRDLIAT